MSKAQSQPAASKTKAPSAAAAAAALNATETANAAAAAEAAAAEAAAAEAAAGAARLHNGLRISAAREGFRRAGRAWSKTPADVPLDDLSDDQVAMLRAEPLLTVEEIVLP